MRNEKGKAVSAFGMRQLFANENANKKLGTFLDPSWFRMQNMSGFSLQALASGATFVAPTGNSIGGANLDADTEYLYQSMCIGTDWEGGTLPYLTICFETDQDNSGGDADDIVRLESLYYIKKRGQSVPRTQTSTVDVTIGAAPQYKMFQAILPLSLSNGYVLKKEDQIATRIRFVATQSDITDIIIVNIHWGYTSQEVDMAGT